MIIANVQAGYSPTEQFIAFVEGSDASAPEQSAFPAQVLAADHSLNHIDGGNPTEGFSPWVTDILVYPSSEYWETLLNGTRVRPYVDLSISNHNTLRIPTAIHGYDLYADTGKLYEGLTVDGDVTVGGTLSVAEITGLARTKLPVSEVTADFTFVNAQTGTIFQSKPAGANTTITLPTSADDGVAFTVMNCLAGKTTTLGLTGTLNARGTILSEEFAAATVYWDGSAWYAFGDLV
jgi:hypothetical protein